MNRASPSSVTFVSFRFPRKLGNEITNLRVPPRSRIPFWNHFLTTLRGLSNTALAQAVLGKVNIGLGVILVIIGAVQPILCYGDSNAGRYLQTLP
jgi:hypothetical protein